MKLSESNPQGRLIDTLIADDEPLARNGLRELLKQESDFRVVAVCNDGQQAIDAVRQWKPDLLFLDIQMPEVSGFEVLNAIYPEFRPQVVFTTAYDQYALDAFEKHALDYLLKPFSQQRFRQSLQRAKAFFAARNTPDWSQLLNTWAESAGHELPSGAGGSYLQRIMLRTDKAIRFVDVGEIDWIEGADYCVNLHCGHKTYLYRESLKNLEARLDPGKFARIHKSAIVNLDAVTEIACHDSDDYRAIMVSGAVLPISRRRKRDLFQLGRERFGWKS